MSAPTYTPPAEWVADVHRLAALVAIEAEGTEADAARFGVAA